MTFDFFTLGKVLFGGQTVAETLKQYEAELPELTTVELLQHLIDTGTLDAADVGEAVADGSVMCDGEW